MFYEKVLTRILRLQTAGAVTHHSLELDSPLKPSQSLLFELDASIRQCCFFFFHFLPFAFSFKFLFYWFYETITVTISLLQVLVLFLFFNFIYFYFLSSFFPNTSRSRWRSGGGGWVGVW